MYENFQTVNMGRSEGDKKIEKLILEVENNPALYDKSSAFFKDTLKKDDIWKTIADRVGFNSKYIKYDENQLFTNLLQIGLCQNSSSDLVSMTKAIGILPRHRSYSRHEIAHVFCSYNKCLNWLPAPDPV